MAIRISLDGTKIVFTDTTDLDEDGIADEAEAIPVLEDVPVDLSGYADGSMFKVGSKTYVVHKG